MHRQSLRAAAISVLAVCAAGCASTPSPAPSASSPAKSALMVPKGQTIVPVNPAHAPAQPASQISVPPATSVPQEIQQAQGLRGQGRLQDAAHVLAQLVLAAPDNPEVLGEYGKTLVQMGRPDDAVAFLKRAVEIRGDDWTIYSALGVAYDQMDDRKNAKVAYERALALHPGEANVLNNYAVSRMLAGDLDAAQRLLMQAQATGRNNAKIAGNLQLLAQMKAKRMPAPPSAVAATGAPKSLAVNAAAVPASAAQPKIVVMQPVPAGTHAPAAAISKTVAMQPVPADAHMKTAPPKTVVTQAVPAGTHAPAAISKTVVMQQVPVDAHAGAAGPPKPLSKLAASETPMVAKVAANRSPAKSSSAKSTAVKSTAKQPAMVKTAMQQPAVAKAAAAKPAALKSALAKSALAKSPPALRTADQGE